jgi:hypothetical protein
MVDINSDQIKEILLEDTENHIKPNVSTGRSMPIAEELPPNLHLSHPESMNESQATVTCIKCGHDNDPISVECIRCGIVFSKYYELQEGLLKHDADQVDALENLRRIIKTHEILRNKKFLEEQKKALVKDKKERERIGSLRKERERQAIMQMKEEIQDETEKSVSDEVEHSLGEKETENARRADGSSTPNEPEEADIPVETGDGVGNHKEVTGEPGAQPGDRIQKFHPFFKSRATLKKLLKPYADQIIGINYDAENTIEPARLTSINNDYFSFFLEESDTLVSIPLANIYAIIESNVSGSAGLDTNPSDTNQPEHRVVVRLFHR